jgi:hypothetical protein
MKKMTANEQEGLAIIVAVAMVLLIEEVNFTRWAFYYNIGAFHNRSQWFW